MTELLLICPKPDQSQNYQDQVYYPQGILSIGSSVQNSGFSVEVIDGAFYNTPDLERKISSASTIGFSASTFNYKTCLELAESAHKQMKRTLIGGPHISALGKIVLENNPFLDAAVINDGEDATIKFLKGDYKHAPNLIYRNEGKICSSAILPPGLQQRIDRFDYSMIPLKEYWKHHSELFPTIDSKFVQILSQIGCYWRASKSGGCSFCSVPYPTNLFTDSAVVWDQVSNVQAQLGITTIKDYADTFTLGERVESLLNARPANGKNVQWLVYGRQNDVTPGLAEMLKELNIKSVFIGLESGNDFILQHSVNKGATIEQGYHAVEILTKAGIEVMASFTVGFKGETEKSLQDTLAMAEQINNNPLVTFTRCGVVMPLPGSRIYKDLLQAHPELNVVDKIDVSEFIDKYQKIFVNVSPAQIKETAQKINDLCKASAKDYFGIFPE